MQSVVDDVREKTGLIRPEPIWSWAGRKRGVERERGCHPSFPVGFDRLDTVVGGVLVLMIDMAHAELPQLQSILNLVDERGLLHARAELE